MDGIIISLKLVSFFMVRIAILFLLFFTACTSETKEEANKSPIFIEQKVNQFVKENPDWSKGEVVKETTTDKFRHAVINWSNEPGFLNNMPLQLEKLRDTTLNDTPFKIATFGAYNDNLRKMGSVLNYIQLQIDAIVPPALEKSLKMNSNYKITGSLYKQGKRGDVKYISVADFKGYDLGKYMFSLTAAKPL